MAPQDARVTSLLERMASMESRIHGIEGKLDRVLQAVSGPQAQGGAGRVSTAVSAIGGLLTSTAPQKMRPKVEAEDLTSQQAQLKRVTTRESIKQVDEGDMAAFIKLYNDHAGQLETLAAETGSDLDLLQRQPPKDATEFAQNMLRGAYTKTSFAEREVQGPFSSSELLSAQNKLKKAEPSDTEGVTARRSTTSAGELEALEAMFARLEGDLQRISEELGASVVQLTMDPPADAKDFARKALAGEYSDEANTRRAMNCPTSEGEESSLAQAVASGRMNFSDKELAAVSGRLTSVKIRPSVANSPSDEDIAALAKIFTDNGGNPDRLASTCGISASLLKRSPPESAEHFARSLLQGMYSEQSSQESTHLEKSPSHSESTSVNQSAFNDVAMIAQLYKDVGDDFDALAQKSGANVKLPKDADDFAAQLLAGSYVADRDLIAQATFRERLADDIVSRMGSNEAAFEFEAAAVLYADYEDDLGRVAELSGCSAEALRGSPPEDSSDFAKRLLRGDYNDDTKVLALTSLRKSLEARQPQAEENLKQVQGSTDGVAEPSKEEIAAVAKLYTDNGGDLDILAELTGSIAASLKASPPLDAEDFAVKLLEGRFLASPAEIARGGLHRNLKGALQAKISTLVAAEASERGPEFAPSAEDNTVVARIYKECGDDLDMLAARSGANAGLLQRAPPGGSEEFAAKLLAGEYVLVSAIARSRLFRNLKASAAGELEPNCASQTQPSATLHDRIIVAKLFEQHEGDFVKVADECNTDAVVLKKNPPDGANDFANRLLDGAYYD